MTPRTSYHTVEVEGCRVFYRKAGDPSAPAMLLLHGFPTSSHMFREIIPLLAQRWHVIAPDLPGFGQTALPESPELPHTFDALADIMFGFAEAIGLRKTALYVFDYGAPVGFRFAMRDPSRITAIISQNGNAYEEGLSVGWDPIRAYWNSDTEENRAALQAFLTPETTRWQYIHGMPQPEFISPDGFTHDQAMLDRPGNAAFQLDLFRDYRNNVALYPAIHAYFRAHKPPLLAVWGKNDPFFLPAGAEAFKRDLPAAEVELYDSGHFALESHAQEIATRIDAFLSDLAS